MSVLFVAGDPGGSRALLGLLPEMEQRGLSFLVLEYGFLERELPACWREHLISPDMVNRFFTTGAIRGLVFGTSVQDDVALNLARVAQSFSIPTVHVLDNWSSYSQRMQTAGKPDFVPSVYTCLDQQSFAAAAADGIPQDCLVLTGHPGLTGLTAVFSEENILQAENLAQEYHIPYKSNKIVAFVMEPFKSVFGTDCAAPGHCGFTEELVFKNFIAVLQKVLPAAFLCVIPHPKQSVAEIEKLWAATKGKMAGIVIKLSNSRQLLPIISGMAGMSSLLLYESWLLGIPVASMLPGCQFQAMKYLAGRKGVYYAEQLEEISPALKAWAGSVAHGLERAINAELSVHLKAPGKIIDIIDDLIK